MTGPYVDPDAGLSEVDKARARASDANLAGIIAGRRAAATRLLALDPEPAQQVREDWKPVRQAVRRRGEMDRPEPTEDSSAPGQRA